MGVPITGNFTMFGNSDNTTVQGAITEGGTDASAATTLNQLIGLSSATLFDATYAGTIINPVSDVSASLQFRGYPGLDCTLTGGDAAVTTYLPFMFNVNNDFASSANLNFTDLANDDAILTYNTTDQITINSSTAVPLNITTNNGISTGQIQVQNFSNTNFAGFNWSGLWKITNITQWGDIKWKSLRFLNAASNLTISATDYPNLTRCTDLSQCFEKLSQFNDSSIIGWDVGNVENMSEMFSGSVTFNQPLNSWDVSNVTNMNGMFQKAQDFNQFLTNWDVSSVTDMGSMFEDATNLSPSGLFKSDGVNTNLVTDMSKMFYGCIYFNVNLNHWNVSSVTDMSFMFASTIRFTLPLSSWDVSSVTDMQAMFDQSKFNGDISNWNVGNVTNMQDMFNYNTRFNQDIDSWDVTSVTNMQGMFRGGIFDQNINSWDPLLVQNMYQMFRQSDFNQPIGNWDVSSVTDMREMFLLSPFNQDIGNWNTGNVVSMYQMFYGTPFNQDIGSWDISSVTNMSTMFGNTNGAGAATLSVANYDALLIGWAAQTVQQNVPFSAGNSQYSSAAINAKNTLVTAGWTITDRGLV